MTVGAAELSEFKTAKNTVVLSDLHLADAERPPPGKPLWKRFKSPDLFVDSSFRKLLEHLQAAMEGPIELVLNGDIFDFDSVLALPERPEFPVSWLERRRGLKAEEPKSRFKIRRILQDHPAFVEALREFLLRGHRVIFVAGNHDIELMWTGVQRDIVQTLDLPEELRENVRFVEWFYISNQDTLIEHGNQYDAYSACANPLYPLIKKGSRKSLRLPFSNLAGRYMTNGMGLFNPHVEGSYIMSFRGYLAFFFRYLLRVQPLLLWTWLWGAIVTLVDSLSEGLKPAYKDPLSFQKRVEEIAFRSNATPVQVMALRELHAHPAVFNPFMVMRELWLDRFVLLGVVWFASFQIFSTLNVFARVSSLWFWIPLALFMAAFIFYAQSVRSDVYKVQKAALRRVPAAAAIAGVSRVVHGHTHRERHLSYKGVEVLNSGTWSPAFHDVECTQPFGSKCFAWIRPRSGSEAGGAGTNAREAGLYVWGVGGAEVFIPPSAKVIEVPLERRAAAPPPAPFKFSRRNRMP
ncbi:MAG: metallophosphoesterase [bacterium]